MLYGAKEIHSMLCLSDDHHIETIVFVSVA